MNLVQGHKELLALIAKKKKTKKPATVLNMGRRFKGPAQPVQVDDIFSKEDDNQEEDGESIKHEGRNNQAYENVHEDEDYSDEQYPHTDDKYKQLEDRLKTMKIQKVPGLDFGELGLISGVVIPHKFKVPIVVPQNFPSHFNQYILLKVLNLLKFAQKLTRQTLS